MTRTPSHPPPSASSPQDRLRRLEQALTEGQERQAQSMEAWVRQMGRLPTKKERRRWEKRWKKRAWREARLAERQAARAEQEARDATRSNPLLGWGCAVGALMLFLVAFRYPRALWWIFFLAAFFLGRLAVRHSRVGGREREEPERALLPAPAREAEPEDPRLARVDALCDKLLAELRTGPAVLREVVHEPEQTVEALRRSCQELMHRERELRALCSPEDRIRLAHERDALAARVEAEGDAVVKERLGAALAVLDEQRRQRAELDTAASRLEAEHTRLFYTLENLYMQVLRVRTADAALEDVAGADLRRGVEQLGAEMEAVTEALEEVHRAPGDRVPTR